MPKFLNYFRQSQQPIVETLEPYKKYDARLRELYAREPGNGALRDPLLNAVPLFDSDGPPLKIRARQLQLESEEEKQKYIMPLQPDNRKPDGASATVDSLKDFQRNFNLFSEMSLSELDWSNVVAAGSSVATPLMAVPEEHAGSKRALRKYYHETFAPASDVDLFLYGLTEEEAIEKIKQIEAKVKDSILQETTTIRTKHAITIVSKYPVRHVQIVLRIYKSISEILTGFDVDCSCVAYDGSQIFASPRAVAAFVTQINPVDLTRRSPSYELRLSKYSHRGFEIYWPELDRNRIDPTIFERSFSRTLGLAKLLVLEQLPKANDRESYLNQRRAERGRPALRSVYRNRLRGNLKDGHDDEVADWVDDEFEVSNYHTLTIPYGPNFYASKIERLLFAKDLLLNAEWNVKDRDVKLHRHPAFFGNAADVVGDCCGYCPSPANPEEEAIAAEESKTYIFGKVRFLVDDPGRQEIGSFNPITDTDWAEMAYIGNTTRLCQAIVDCDVEKVKECLSTPDFDPNRRDHTGRTPLHLAVTSSTVEIVNCLLEHGANLIWRLADGRTALHLASSRGDPRIVAALLERSDLNAMETKKETEAVIEAATRHSSTAASNVALERHTSEGNPDAEEAELLEPSDTDSVTGSEASGDLGESTFIKIETCKKDLPKKPAAQETAEASAKLEKADDVFDLSAPSWDSGCVPHHYAIALGKSDALDVLLSHDADPLVPIKLTNAYNGDASGAILSLVLALILSPEKAKVIVKKLLDAGAKSSQADLDANTALHYFANHNAEMLDYLFMHDRIPAKKALHWVAVGGYQYTPTYATPLRAAIENGDFETFQKLLDLGSKIEVDYESWIKGAKLKFKNQLSTNTNANENLFGRSVDQPVILAVRAEQPKMVRILLDRGADKNVLTSVGQSLLTDEFGRSWKYGATLLDEVQDKLVDFRSYTSDNTSLVEHPPLQPDVFYLENFEPGSYKHWIASQQLKAEKEVRTLPQIHSSAEKREEGEKLKLESMTTLISEFEALETHLLNNGAKKFAELHPGIGTSNAATSRNRYRYTPTARKPFEVQFSFNVPGAPEKDTPPYLQLFQAAWEGDLATIRNLTMQPRDSGSRSLKITVSDQFQSSPFFIAIVRGHMEVAKAILEIAQIQYLPKTQDLSYTLADDNASEDSDGSDDEPENDMDRIRIYSRLPESVRKQFTIDDINKISTEVRSDVSPISLLQQVCPTGRFVQNEEDYGAGVFGYAICTDNFELFSTLLDLAKHYQALESSNDDTDSPDWFTLRAGDFQLALRQGRTRFLAEFLRHSGTGLPLEQLVKASGVEIKEKPKYYQGLSIRGRKRKDWADSYRTGHRVTLAKTHPPLLEAVKLGNIDSVEWLLSDAPIRLYKEFAEANAHDQRLKSLSSASGGLDHAIVKWLDTRRKYQISSSMKSIADSPLEQLALHVAILGRTGENVQKLVSYLIKAIPASLNARSVSGMTPLHVAFALQDAECAKLLIEAGAEVYSRDDRGNNILHLLLLPAAAQGYSGPRATKVLLETLSTFMELLSPKQQEDLLLQRNSYSEGARTPLHNWLHRVCEKPVPLITELVEAIFRALLKVSRGPEFTMVDGSGETLAHTLVTSNQTELLKILLEFQPQALLRENAVGRTPLEVVQDRWLSEHIQSAPQLGNRLQSILTRSSESFLAPDQKPDEPAESIHTLWQFCQSHMERHPGKRVIVSLNEANEVARRLAETRSKAHSGRSEQAQDLHGDIPGANDDQDTGDEVTEWFSNAVEATLQDC
jgi:ankyrin repeat protein